MESELKAIEKRLEAIEERLTSESEIMNIRDNFFNKLQEKSGWGKNDIMKAYDQAVLESLLKSKR